jgi:trimeric autotransporter adhesin
MMSVLGTCGSLTSSTYITVNELTTVAAVWALAPFMSSYSSVGSGAGDAAALASVFTLASYYVNVATGMIPGQNVPAGTTVPIAQINTLANILSSCVNSTGGVAGDGSPCGTLFAAATPNGGTTPANVIGAGLNIANNPLANVSSLYGLVQATAPYQPTVTMAPPNLTVGLIAPMGVSLSSDALTFPAAYLGVASLQTIVVTSNAPLLTSFSLPQVTGADAADFGAGTTCSSQAAGSTCTVNVSFVPTAVGPRSAYLLLRSSAANSPLVIPLTGAGLALSGGPVTLSPSPLQFILVDDPEAVTVTNFGTTPVTIANVTVAAGFSQTNNCGSTLAPQSICTIMVQIVNLTAAGPGERLP